MKSSFPGYIRPTQQEFNQLWLHARIIVDANVLLNAYGYSAETREKLFAILERVGDRLWIPHQFALEFLRNRPGVILKQARNIGRVAKELRKILDHDFRSQTNQPFVPEKVVSSLDSLCEELDNMQAETEGLLRQDANLERILRLFDGRVGPESAALQKLYEEGRERYAQKTPPGYADEKEKGEPECFGDFIGWKQILDFSLAESCSVLFVTDDTKEDWWQIYESRTIGPRPELLAEFVHTSNNVIYLYSSSSFVERASEQFNIEPTPGVIEELKAAFRARIAEQSAQKSVPKAKKMQESKVALKPILSGLETPPETPKSDTTAEMKADPNVCDS
jgi:hypothetical protein